MKYKKAAKKLKETVAEKAREVIQKMTELEINGENGGLLVDGLLLKTKKIKSFAGGSGEGSVDILTFGDDPGDLSNERSSATSEHYYLHRDFDAKIYYAHPRTFLLFANNYEKIERELERAEEYLAAEMERARNKMEKKQILSQPPDCLNISL